MEQEEEEKCLQLGRLDYEQLLLMPEADEELSDLPDDDNLGSIQEHLQLSGETAALGQLLRDFEEFSSKENISIEEQLKSQTEKISKEEKLKIQQTTASLQENDYKDLKHIPLFEKLTLFIKDFSPESPTMIKEIALKWPNFMENADELQKQLKQFCLLNKKLFEATLDYCFYSNEEVFEKTRLHKAFTCYMKSIKSFIYSKKKKIEEEKKEDGQKMPDNDPKKDDEEEQGTESDLPSLPAQVLEIRLKLLQVLIKMVIEISENIIEYTLFQKYETLSSELNDEIKLFQKAIQDNLKKDLPKEEEKAGSALEKSEDPQKLSDEEQINTNSKIENSVMPKSLTSEKNIENRKSLKESRVEIAASYEFNQHKQIYLIDIINDFQIVYSQHAKFMLKLTKNQVVIISDSLEIKQVEKLTEISKLLKEKSSLFKKFESINLVESTESVRIYNFKAFSSNELALILPNKETVQGLSNYQSVLMQIHTNKLLAHSEHVAKIMEEIIEYNPTSKKVVNYLAIAENSQTNLKTLVSLWSDKQKATAQQEEFTPEKLAYICLQAMEALNHCHSHHVYYGDISPSSLMIFKDYAVKLGKFQNAIKLKSPEHHLSSSSPNKNSSSLPSLAPNNLDKDQNSIYLELKASLKGYSNYCTPKIIELCEDDSQPEVRYQDLLENDYFSLVKTFQDILLKFESEVSSESIIVQLVSDLASMDLKYFTLSQTLLKWKAIISNDKNFILDLCSQMIKEEKFSALINILKISKYRNLFREISTNFKKKESEEYKQAHIQQFKENVKKEKQITQFDYLYSQISLTQLKNPEVKVTNDLRQYIMKMLLYRGPLDSSYYKDFYFNHFSNLFLFKSDLFKENVQLSKVNFNSCPRILLIKSALKEKEEFQRFLYFTIYTSAHTTTWFEQRLSELIELANELKFPILELELIYHYNKTPFDYNTPKILERKLNFAFRSKNLCRELKLKYDKAIECYLHALLCKKTVEGKIYRYDIKFALQMVKIVENFNDYKKKSYFSLYYSMLAQSEEIKEIASQKLKMLLKESAIFAQQQGDSGEMMLQNSFNLYLLCREGELKDIKVRDMQMKKLINCSYGMRKAEFLAFKLDDMLKQIQSGDQASTIKLERFLMVELIQLKKLSPFLYSLTMSYVQSQLKLNMASFEIQQDEKAIDRYDILNTHHFYQILRFLKPSTPIYLTTFQQFIGAPHSTDFSEPKLQYESWANAQYQEIFSKFRVTDFEKIETLPEPQQDLQREKILSKVQVVIPRIGKYIGEIAQNQFNGTGKFKFEGGNTFSGEFKNGLFNGQGRLEFEQSDYESYNGNFKDNLFHGIGTLSFRNGDKYFGQFESGVCQGKGIFEGVNQIKYNGDFYKQKRQGKGKEWSLNRVGVEYDGEWVNDKKNGKGKFTVPANEIQQEIYDGLWKNNKRNGEGTQIYKNGVTYQGEWSDDKRNGQGTLAKVGGFQFSGTWKDGEFLSIKEDLESIVENDGEFVKVFHYEAVLESGHNFKGYITEDKTFYGKGELHYTNGQIYNGWFKNGKKNGYGELTFPNKDRYMGMFKDNKKYGEGVFQIATGQLNKVEWYNNKQIECISRLDDTDEVYEGLSLNGKKQGLGFLNDKLKKQTYSGYFIDNMMEGHGELVYANGDSYVGEFLKGLRHGQGRLNFKDGGFFEGAFFKDIYHGKGKLSRKEQINAKVQSKEENSEKQLNANEVKAQVEDAVIVEKTMTLYEGDFKNGKKNGFGVYTYDDYEFRGDFIDDLKHGFGVYQTKYSEHKEDYEEKYEGNFENNFKHGFGKFSTKERRGRPIVFIGNFKDGKFSGYGRLFLEKKLVYEGEFLNGEKQGHGKKYQKRDDYTYIGPFFNGRKHGVGKKINKNGDILKGEFKEGHLNGEGSLISKRGDHYKGLFKSSQQNGQGQTMFSQEQKNDKWLRSEFKLINEEAEGAFIPLTKMNEKDIQDFDIQNKFKEIMEEKINAEKDEKKQIKWRDQLAHLEYICEYFSQPVSHNGLYKGSQLDGKGIWKFKDCYFDGLLENNGLKEGVLVFTNGSRKGEEYKGQFKGFRMIGEGTYRCKSGAIYTGEFFKNQRSSFASSYIYGNGDKYVGFLLPNYDKHGIGELTKAIGEVFKGRFLNNQRAEGVLSLNGKTLYEGHYKNDLKHYFGTEYFEQKGEQFRYKGSFIGGFKFGKGEYEKISGEDKFNKNVLITFDLSTRSFKCICTDDDSDIPTSEINQEISPKQGTTKDEKGNIYSGDLINGIIMGTGTLSFPNKDLFTGGFINGFRDGYGSYFWANKSIYTGEFKNNIMEGFGLIQYFNGDQYRGQFVNGLREGKGTYMTKEKISYSGVFKKGTLDYGTYKDSQNQFSREGKFDFNKKVFKFNEDIEKVLFPMQEEETYEMKQSKIIKEDYEGRLEKGMKQGQGKLIYPNGSVFEGKFENNQRISGTITTSSQDRITVEKFDDDEIIRPVKIHFKNGDKYSGKISDFNLEDQNGTMEFESGNTYQGNFVNNQIQGEGTLKTALGKFTEVYTGLFIFGQRHGKGVLTFPNEDSFDGIFKEDEIISGIYKSTHSESEKQGGGYSKSQAKAMQLGKSQDEKSLTEKSWRWQENKIICKNLDTLQEKYFSSIKKFEDATKTQIICLKEVKYKGQEEELLAYVAHPLLYVNSVKYAQRYSVPMSLPEFSNLYEHQQSFALKITYSEDQNTFEQALEESQLRQLIKSPFVAQTQEVIIEYSLALNEIFIIVELFDFKTSCLNQLVQRKSLEQIKKADNQEEIQKQEKKDVGEIKPEQEKKDIVKQTFILYQVITAMTHFHSQGIVINNFSPQNIIVLPNLQVQILDLSLAQTKQKQSSYFPKEMTNQEYSSESYRIAYAQQQSLSWEELIQNDICGVTQLIQDNFISIEEFQNSKQQQWFQKFRNDCSPIEFEKILDELRIEISASLEMKTQLATLASQNNLEGQLYIQFAISRNFDLTSETFPSFIQPLRDLQSKLQMLSITSLSQAFKNVYLADLNLKYREIELYLPEFAKVKKGKDLEVNLFGMECDWLEEIIQQNLQISEDRSKTETYFDWTKIEKEIKASSTLEKLVNSILTFVDKSGILVRKEVLEKISAQDYFRSYLAYSMDNFKKQINLMVKTDLTNDLDEFKQKKLYEELVLDKNLLSEFYSYQRFNSVIKRIKKLAEKSLSVVVDINNFASASFRNIQALNFIGSIIKLEEKDQYILKNALLERNVSSAYNLFQDMTRNQKKFLASQLVQRVGKVYDKEESPFKLILLFDQIKYLCSSYYPYFTSESRFFFKAKQFKNSVDHIKDVIQKQDLSIYGIYAELEQGSNLEKFIEKPKMNEEDHKCLETLKKLSINFEIKAFLKEVNTNIPLNYEETISYLHDLDFDSSDNSKSPLTSDEMYNYALINFRFGVSVNKITQEGFCLDSKVVNNDFRKYLATYLANQQPINLSSINIYQILVVQIDGFIKALKTVYKIRNEKVETPWYGYPKEELSSEYEDGKVVVTLDLEKQERITQISVNRDTHLGLKIITNLKKRYFFGDYEKYDGNEEEFQYNLTHKVLWLETAFMPEDLDFPDPFDKQLYHLAFYETEVKVQ